MTISPSSQKSHNMKPRQARCMNMFCHAYRIEVTVDEPGAICPRCGKYLITIVKSLIDGELASRDSQTT